MQNRGNRDLSVAIAKENKTGNGFAMLYLSAAKVSMYKSPTAWLQRGASVAEVSKLAHALGVGRHACANIEVCTCCRTAQILNS